MICNNCTHLKVCMHYKYAMRNNLEYSKCIYNASHKSEIDISKVRNNFKPFTFDKDGDKATLKKIIFETKETKKDFNDKRKVNKKTSSIVTCPTCGGADYKELLLICDKCSETICGNCGTYLEGANYCKECYSKM